MKLTVDVYESVTGRIKLGKVGSDCGVKGYRITMKHLGTTELDITETQAPSATVDEQTQTIAELIFAVATNDDETEENRIAWIKREMLDTLVARVKNSQQPAVDVDVDVVKNLCSKIYDYIYFYNGEDAKRLIEKALQEALRGTYTREDMIAFGMDCCSNWDDNGIIDAKLVQYDTERNTK